jgi:hypothetical protein
MDAISRFATWKHQPGSLELLGTGKLHARKRPVGSNFQALVAPMACKPCQPCQAEVTGGLRSPADLGLKPIDVVTPFEDELGPNMYCVGNEKVQTYDIQLATEATARSLRDMLIDSYDLPSRGSNCCLIRRAQTRSGDGVPPRSYPSDSQPWDSYQSIYNLNSALGGIQFLMLYGSLQRPMSESPNELIHVLVDDMFRLPLLQSTLGSSFISHHGCS